MTDVSPADQIRAAAELLRALATAASTDPDGLPTARWHTEPCWPDDDSTRFLYGDHLTRDDGRRISWPLLNRGGSPQRPSYMHGQHAEYAAAMDPTVGLALADWLDAAAEDAEQVGPDPRAVAVARRILGDDRA